MRVSTIATAVAACAGLAACSPPYWSEIMGEVIRPCIEATSGDAWHDRNNELFLRLFDELGEELGWQPRAERQMIYERHLQACIEQSK